MSDNDVVTKGFLKSELKRGFEKFHTEFRQEVHKDMADLINDSIIPLLEKMDKNMEEIKTIVDSHERRLGRHDERLYAHDRLLQKLTA